MTRRSSGASSSSARSRLALLIALLCCYPAVAARTVEADFNTEDYTRSAPTCGQPQDRADPAGIVFYGYGAYAESHGHSHRTFDLLNQMSNWGNTTGSTQYMGSHGVCTVMERQIADNVALFHRYHIRLNQTHHQDTLGRYESVGDPHWEEVDFPCGHAVPPDDPATSNPDSGFDLGRGRVKNNYVATFGSAKLGDTQNWGNTSRLSQCNGWLSGSSGRVYWLKTD